MTVISNNFVFTVTSVYCVFLPLKRCCCQTDRGDATMFLSSERRSQLSFVSPNIKDDSFRLLVAWVVGVTRARASRLDSRPAREAPADHRYENTEVKGGCTEMNCMGWRSRSSKKECLPLSSFFF